MNKKWNYPSIDYMKSGKILFDALHAMGISPIEAAEYMGYSEYRTVYKWKLGKSLPKLENLYAFSRLIGVPMDMLIIGKDEDWKYTRVLRFFRLMSYQTRIMKVYSNCSAA